MISIMRFTKSPVSLWVAGQSTVRAAMGTRHPHVTRMLLHQSCHHHRAPSCNQNTSSSCLLRVFPYCGCSVSPIKTRSQLRCYSKSTEDNPEDCGMISDSEFESDVFHGMKMLDKDQFELLRVNLYPNSRDPVVKAISDASSVQEVFDQIEISRGCPTAEQLSQAVVTLWDLQKVYGRYGYDCSLITKHHVNKLLEKILGHPTFEKLISCLEDVHEDLNNTALSCMLLYLNKIGIENSSSIMQKLTFLCIERIHDLSLSGLSRVTVYLRDQGIKAYFLQSKLLPIIASRLKSYLNGDELHLITICFNSTKRLLTESIIDEYIDVIEKKVNEQFFKSCDPKITMKVIKLLTSPDWSPKRKSLARHLMLSLVENFHKLNIAQVIDLSIYFQSYLEPREIFYKIQQYSINAIEEAKTSGMKPHLLCLAQYTSPKMKDYFEHLVAEQLEYKDLYENILDIFKALRYIKSSNVKLCDAFWIKSLNAVEDEIRKTSSHYLGMEDLTRRRVYQRYMYFNNNLGGTYRNFILERTMSALLLEDIGSAAGLLPSKIASMASFLLSYSSREGIPDNVFEKVLLCGPQFSIHDIVILSRGIQISLALNRNNRCRTLMQQITAICRMLDSRTEEILKSARSLMDITHLSRGYLSRSGSPRAFMFDKIVSSHIPLLHELNARHIKEICICFNNTLYLASEILDALVEYVVGNHEHLLLDTMEQVLTCFYNLGHTPQHEERFLSACTNSFLQDGHRMRGLNVLQMCLALNMYGHLPTKAIQKVFNLNFMDQLDDEIENCYSKATYPLRVRHMLMELNRAVCLDHPEENIPWFHEKYCEELLETVAVPNTVFHTEVHQALVQLVGGPEVLRANVKTPYYYLLDFEFVLDGDTCAVPVKEYISASGNSRTPRSKLAPEVKPGYRRMAIILRKENHYCINSRQLLGRHQVERRHLEVMGYTVVEVPHFLWYSMAHANFDEKVQYLRDLIFHIK